MAFQKTKSINQIEERMETLEPESLRYKILDSARRFKSSWIELGQYLFIVYKDKMFKNWGYLTFEAYCSKEIGIRQVTAMKLLKSYSFLEHEEPAFLKRQSFDEPKPNEIPSVDSVNMLRLAKQNTRVSEDDYKTLRGEVLDEVKEDAEVKKKIKYILKSNAPKSITEDTVGRKDKLAGKFLSQLRTARHEMGLLSFPAKIVKQVDELIDILEDFQG
ncbi:MAG: hypothetical protein AUJ72_03615 [Candidatus Omnitrophica bacterium CG1_02_46_14]|nr:MAG: hypothetical protein AUJ72_03615 [Candidatus Omnitrophica bacterium CG1_02_46_14]